MGPFVWGVIPLQFQMWGNYPSYTYCLNYFNKLRILSRMYLTWYAKCKLCHTYSGLSLMKLKASFQGSMQETALHGLWWDSHKDDKAKSVWVQSVSSQASVALCCCCACCSRGMILCCGRFCHRSSHSMQRTWRKGLDFNPFYVQPQQLFLCTDIANSGSFQKMEMNMGKLCVCLSVTTGWRRHHWTAWLSIQQLYIFKCLFFMAISSPTATPKWFVWLLFMLSQLCDPPSQT